MKEKDLSEKFGVSKAPVREALIELSKENIVKSIPRAGYRIVQFTGKDIFQATELRLILELSMLDTIIDSIRPESLQRLYGEMEKFNAIKRRGKVPLDVWWNSNISFHVALNAEGGNSMLTGVLESALFRLWRAIAQLFWSGNPEDYIDIEPDNHIALLQAIEGKNNARAREILSEDILSIRGILTEQWIAGSGKVIS